jgi:hypothetical protein
MMLTKVCRSTLLFLCFANCFEIHLSDSRREESSVGADGSLMVSGEVVLLFYGTGVLVRSFSILFFNLYKNAQ